MRSIQGLLLGQLRALLWRVVQVVVGWVQLQARFTPYRGFRIYMAWTT